ncbi:MULTISPECIES: hypothetical protein [Mycobacteriaceae]|uniref:HNH endonuclease n=1 Tax=Mycolicibacillus parakoreensis TaxID=1069221 RepID=A0ABY3U6R0_9MYCO|nr:MULTISPECIES: hypothetical protein [Mycobacteriaceae]MCV7316206.1 hypothetical protein [Mycolicibacillus parakoreensis]ULN54801.1 hypothetical protein MIU77_18825 [Mycolicibacillus parakoreensis]
MTADAADPDRIQAALAELRAEATAALEALTRHRDRAVELRAAADDEQRAYAAAYRAIRARGWFTVAQLTALGCPAPRTRRKRATPATGRERGPDRR